jgi:hypothetical protein
MIEFFDIGNHIELAARIIARPEFDARRRCLSYNTATNKAVYVAANTGTANPGVVRSPQPWETGTRSYGDAAVCSNARHRDPVDGCRQR